MAHKKAIRDWSAEDRPREKLFRLGVEQLSTSELVGILLQSGNREKTAVELGMELLEMAKQTLRRAGAILFVKVPATIITSDCLGDARGAAPNLSRFIS